MTFLATTRAAILRGTTKDPLGDEGDANSGSPVAGYADLPASIIEKTRQVFDPASGQRRTVRYTVGRIRSDVLLREGDRLRDNRTGKVYNINETVTVPRGLSGQASLTLDLTSA